MATAPVSQVLNRGGAFLITPCRPEDVFTPADFSDDQRLIGQTAEEFVQKEVVPEIPLDPLPEHSDRRVPEVAGVQPGQRERVGRIRAGARRG